MTLPRLLFVPAFALLVPFTSAVAQETAVQDTGHFIVYERGRRTGVEQFAWEIAGDTVLISSRMERTIRRQDGSVSPFYKVLELVANPFDLSLRSYMSRQLVDSLVLLREIRMRDTTFTVVRQNDDFGTADELPMPPGRWYPIDTQLFTLFDVLVRTLHGREFDERPITLFVLGSEDHTLEAKVRDLGTAPFLWGRRSVRARKLLLIDPSITFTAWVSPDGRLLRLESAEHGLRVDRGAPRPPASRSTTRRRAAPSRH